MTQATLDEFGPDAFEPPEVDPLSCPTCGEEFDTHRGTVNHYNVSHNETSPLDWRFWSKVDVGTPDECWEWMASTHEYGYGIFNLNRCAIGAHRVSLNLSGADICLPPENKDVHGYALHHCDNPPCVNPNHLYVGTPQDNVDDAIERGGIENRYRGESNPGTNLDEQDVLEIRERHASGEPQKTLSDEYGVCPTEIGNIASGETWGDVGGPRSSRGSELSNAHLTEDDVREIRERYATGDVYYKELAGEYPVGTSGIGLVVTGECWPDAPGPIKGEDYE